MKIVSALFAIVFVASFLFVGLTSSTPYDPWYDFNSNGEIDIFDIVDIAGRYGTTGTPINTTELLLELQARIDELEVIVASHKECVVVTGSIHFDGNGAYDAITGLSQDVSGLVPVGFNLVAAVATGYKVDEMSGSRINEPPLILEPKVSGTTFQTRVWDSSGNEYGGPNWSGMKAHIDYTLFITK